METVHANIDSETIVMERPPVGTRSSQMIFYRAAALSLGLLSGLMLVGVITRTVIYSLNEAEMTKELERLRTQVKQADVPVRLVNSDRGNETSLSECGHRGIGNHNCSHQEEAGVVCTDSQPAEGDVRLQGGNSSCSGRVEVFYSGQWGTVCDDRWDMNEAQVVCRQMACGPARSAPDKARFGQGTGPIWLDEVSCRGYETSLRECGHRGIEGHNCGHQEDAGVTCEADAPVRLVNSDSRCSGRVEVFYSGQWGTVCDADWSINEAQVVCRQTGCGPALSALGGAHFGQGSGPIWMNDVTCRGHETSLSECGHRGIGNHNCGHQEEAGVVCTEQTCPSGWRKFRSSCYFFSQSKASRSQSRQDCRDRGADLVVIESPEERELLSDRNLGDTWIGLSNKDNEGTWTWVDGTPLTQGSGSNTEPNNEAGKWDVEDCVFQVFERQDWNGCSCDATLFWICEK